MWYILYLKIVKAVGRKRREVEDTLSLSLSSFNNYQQIIHTGRDTNFIWSKHYQKLETGIDRVKSSFKNYVQPYDQFSNACISVVLIQPGLVSFRPQNTTALS
jgi:hypothetical protein